MPKPKKEKSPASTEKRPMGIPEAVRDVVIFALERGAFMPVSFAALLFLLLWRAPAENIGRIIDSVVNLFELLFWIGWILFVLVCVGWYRHVQWIRKENQRELDRLSEERNILQNMLNDGSITSSTENHLSKK